MCRLDIRHTVCHWVTVGSISGQNFTQLFFVSTVLRLRVANDLISQIHKTEGQQVWKMPFFSFNQFLFFPLILWKSKLSEKLCMESYYGHQFGHLFAIKAFVVAFFQIPNNNCGTSIYLNTWSVGPMPKIA